MVYFDLLIRATRCQVSNTKLDFFYDKWTQNNDN